MDYAMNEGYWKWTGGNKMAPPRVPQLITIYMWGNRHGISMELFSSMVRFNSKIWVYKLYSTIWIMIWIRGIENRQGQQNDAPPRILLAYHHLYMMQQAVYQYGTFQQYG